MEKPTTFIAPFLRSLLTPNKKYSDPEYILGLKKPTLTIDMIYTK